MKGFNPKSVFAIAKKEFLDNIRNKWVILLTIIFVLLIIIFSYAAGAIGGELFGDIESTVLFMVGVTSFIIPLIAIILGFSTISGEAENGSLYVVLSYPVSRFDVLIGKLIGLASVISISIFIGFGVGGLIIALTAGTESIINYVSFIFLSIFIGIIYLSLSILGSSISKTRTRSIAFGLLILFWGMIYGTVMFAILYATGNSFESIPEWFFDSAILSPGDMHQTTVMRAFGIGVISFEMGPQQTFTFPIPDFLSLGNLLICHCIWFAIPFSLAYRFFKKRDI